MENLLLSFDYNAYFNKTKPLFQTNTDFDLEIITFFSQRKYFNNLTTIELHSELVFPN